MYNLVIRHYITYNMYYTVHYTFYYIANSSVTLCYWSMTTNSNTFLANFFSMSPQ